jgi:hypothetical protein
MFTIPADWHERIVYRECIEDGIEAVAWYDGPGYGIGYAAGGAYFDVDRVGDEDAHEFVRHAVRYGREYAHFPAALAGSL